jgi:Beta-lactamase enzyme family/Polyglycine hydrolase-like, structural repeat
MLRKCWGKAGRMAGKALVTCAVSVALVFSFVMPAGATNAFPTTDDHSTEIATGWWWYYGETASQVGTLLNQHGARPTQIRVMNPTGPSGPTFAVTMVANTGAYASGWWWYFGQTSAQVTALLTKNNARLISLDPYFVNGQLLFAVVMVPNTGAQGRAWWWYFGVTSDQVNGFLSANNARLTELRPYMDNGQRVFAVIMISNTGGDAAGWEWWTNASPSFIASHINSDGMRVIALAPDPLGNFDVIMVSSEGETWYWWYGINAATVEKNVTDHQTRLIDISPYGSTSNPVFTAVEIGDNNPPQAPINTRSAQVANYANTHGWAGGYNGSYFISSTPGAKPVIAVNSNFRYEPASSIKVLYLLYTLRSGVSLNSPITYYWTSSGPPNPNACPANVPQTAANRHTTTIGTALTDMIQQSNNIYTRAFALRWGLGPVQAMANSLGMTSTHLNQAYIGCGFLGGVRNELTLADAAKLYAAVSNSKALTGKARTTFFNILVGGTPVATDPFGSVVKAEAAALKKSGVVSKFLANMNVRWKAGSYEFCLATGCTQDKLDLALTGWMSIPFMVKGKVVAHTYEFGDFVNDLVETCSSCVGQTNAFNNLENVGAQAALTTIKQALATWP